MALSFSQGIESKNGASNTTQTATINATLAGELIYAHILSFEVTNPQVPSGVTLGGAAMTKFSNSAQVWTGGLLGVCTAIYWKVAAGGETTVTATWALAQGFREIHMLNIRGFTTPVEDSSMQTNGPVSSKAGASVSIITGPSFTPIAQPGVICAFCGVGASLTVVGGGFSDGAGTGDRASYLLTSSLSTQTPQWTDSTTNDDYASDVVGFREKPAFISPQESAILQAVKQGSYV